MKENKLRTYDITGILKFSPVEGEGFTFAMIVRKDLARWEEKDPCLVSILKS